MSFVVPNYKILAFDPDMGSITLNFEGYAPVAYQAPFVNGAYLSGKNLDTWVKAMFSMFGHYEFGTDAPIYSEITNAAAVLSIVDGTPYPY